MVVALPPKQVTVLFSARNLVGAFHRKFPETALESEFMPSREIEPNRGNK